MNKQNEVSRRSFLMRLGLLINGGIAALLAVPVVGYILSPLRGKSGQGYNAWVSLGSLSQFPEGETRLATFRNPFRAPLGWPDRRHSVLGPALGRRDLSGIRHQLRASRLSRPLVLSIRAVHVSVPRWRLLC